MATGNDQIRNHCRKEERQSLPVFGSAHGVEIQISCNPDMKVSATILRSFVNELRNRCLRSPSDERRGDVGDP